MLFNDRRANKRALKAAQGPSLAPKGYKADTTGRQQVRKAAVSGSYRPDGNSNKQRYAQAASDVTLSNSNYINGKYGPYNAPKGKK